MIANDSEFHHTQERIRRFEDQVARLRQTEPDPANYRASAGGFLAEIDRLHRDVIEFLSRHPAEGGTNDSTEAALPPSAEQQLPGSEVVSTHDDTGDPVDAPGLKST